MNLIVVSGQPGTGKTTVARALSAALSMPLIEKDAIKEALHRVLPARDVESSRSLGQATYEVMFALAPTFERVIVESNFSSESVSRLRSVEPNAMEIHCVCEPSLALERFARRHRGGPHFDAERLPELRNRFEKDGQPALVLGGPLIEIDTTTDVDVGRLALWVRSHLDRG